MLISGKCIITEKKHLDSDSEKGDTLHFKNDFRKDIQEMIYSTKI